MGGKPSAQRSAIQSVRNWSRDRQVARINDRDIAKCGNLAPLEGKIEGSGEVVIEGAPQADVSTKAPESRARFDASTEITSPQINLKSQGAVASSGGVAVSGDAEAKTDNRLEVLGCAHKVRVESLAVASSARDVNMTFSHTSHNYYISPQHEAGLSIPPDMISQSPHGPSISSTARELSSIYHEFGAALAELKTHTDDNHPAIGQKFQDLYERMGHLQSAIFQPTHISRMAATASAITAHWDSDARSAI
ncbi:hypothetical protein FA13DRAFT_1798447 [Coprinellus micaceus]|uniref:Uncharacterized protein n=1 Tax=Coprinellus micaceus TaxID=71717 RepID=A0A4Y7SMI6_COPMI|nr:hypothetical protein FA13DRAFT_1798447 [Coprinellus micaceus]